MTLEAVRTLLLKRAARVLTKRRGSTGVTAWARLHGVSKGHVSEFLAGKRLPTTNILNALGLEWAPVRKRK